MSTGAPTGASRTGARGHLCNQSLADRHQTTGEPHLGNLIGAIRPALDLADRYHAMYFIADYHALTGVRDRELLAYYSRSVAATWIAAGLDPNRITLYRQSDIPETFELAWILSCVTAKG